MRDPERGASPTHAYVFGHSDRELERLKAQARLIDPITRRFFREAGIVPGMHVLDVGSGAGDVAFLAADIVGDRGEVVGIDRVPAALRVARERAAALQLRNVPFREGNPAEMGLERPFDAVVGRYVLQFQQDPAAMLRKLAAQGCASDPGRHSRYQVLLVHRTRRGPPPAGTGRHHRLRPSRALSGRRPPNKRLSGKRSPSRYRP